MNTQRTLLALTFVVLAFALSAITFSHAVAAANSTPTVQGSDVVVSLVNQNPDPAVAGDPVEVRLGVQNQGLSTRDNLVVEMIPSYPFTTLSGEKMIQTI